jgi:hypothetical protein
LPGELESGRQHSHHHVRPSVQHDLPADDRGSALNRRFQSESEITAT